MTVEEVKEYCLSKKKAYEDYPFGDFPICYKLNGKLFAQLYPMPSDVRITLKCTKESGEFFKAAYPGRVVRGYHCPKVQQPYFITVLLSDFPDSELTNLIDLSYEAVFDSFSRKVREQLLTQFREEQIKQENNSSSAEQEKSKPCENFLR